MRWPLILAAVVALALAAPALTSAKGGRPVVVSANCHGHNFKPGRIILACGDAGLVVEHLKWQSWGRREAKGAGTGTAKTCDPNCAAGGSRSGPMQIRLLRTARCPQDGRVHFTRIEYRWSNGSPISGEPDRGVVPSPCSVI